MNKKIGEELIGWYGTVSIILAYAFLSFGLFDAKDIVYQILNCTGALGIVYISLKKKAYQPAVLNIIWAIIGAFSVVNIILTIYKQV